MAEAEDDTSCAALNRLRAKLRELMKNGEEADRQVADVVERSMDTMVDLSKGCEELKLDNERLYRLLKDLGISPEEIDEYLKNLVDDPAIYKSKISIDLSLFSMNPFYQTSVRFSFLFKVRKNVYFFLVQHRFDSIFNLSIEIGDSVK